jgi:hypothetical protein
MPLVGQRTILPRSRNGVGKRLRFTQRQTVRGEIPNSRATSFVRSSGGRPYRCPGVDVSGRAI